MTDHSKNPAPNFPYSTEVKDGDILSAKQAHGISKGTLWEAGFTLYPMGNKLFRVGRNTLKGAMGKKAKPTSAPVTTVYLDLDGGGIVKTRIEGGIVRIVARSFELDPDMLENPDPFDIVGFGMDEDGAVYSEHVHGNAPDAPQAPLFLFDISLGADDVCAPNIHRVACTAAEALTLHGLDKVVQELEDFDRATMCERLGAVVAGEPLADNVNTYGQALETIIDIRDQLQGGDD